MEDAKHPVSFSPDGSLVATASSSDDILVWNPGTGKLMQRLYGLARTTVSLAISPNNTRAVAASDDGRMHLWDIASGRKLCTQTLDLAAIRDSSITVPAFSNDGQRIAWVIGGDTVQVWDKATGTMMEQSSKDLGDINYVAFSPLANHVI
ncbi:YVTN repeat-like/Quino protein amine dehydrogenase, partial [Leucogyrophana mollusca]